ncbi:MAG: hypothetical protein ACXVB0_13545 [Mucilaginibacter sp.]
MTISSENWPSEIVINSNCGYEDFYKIAHALELIFNLSFSQKLKGLDSIYWDFCYKGSRLTLHYNIYAGVSILPEAIKEATIEDKDRIGEIGGLLISWLAQIADKNNL